MDEILVDEVCEDAWTSISCEGLVRLTVCPYEADVNNKQVPTVLCERHDYERGRDI